MSLLTPLSIGRHTARSRVMFGPHETNLAWGRAISDRHVAYYRERAAGGCGIIVIEEASVHLSDWPYERSPEAAQCGPGWRAVASACQPLGALVLAGLGHSGGQGSSAFSQRELWAPSDEPEVSSREVPKVMEPEDIAEVVAGFAASATGATQAGLDGVEINAGQHSLIRQFLSGLTNRRNDDYGQDRLRLAREVLVAVRAGLGPEPILGLRLSCDEMAPWAGITPEAAVDVARELATLVDYLVVVRGSIFSVAETRPTGHHGQGFNLELAGAIRQSIDGIVPVVAQGSIVDPTQADEALAAGHCDAVEMTRAQIADPDLVAKLRLRSAPRPCVLCNQRCKVRDNRNPIVSCIAEPRAGYETIDPTVPTGAVPTRAVPTRAVPTRAVPTRGLPTRAMPTVSVPTVSVPTRLASVDTGTDGSSSTGLSSTRPSSTSRHPLEVLVVGAGPAGLEAARVAARAGHQVQLVDAAERTGGMARVIARAPGHHRFADLIEWLTDDALANGVELRLGQEYNAEEVTQWTGPVILATGSKPGEPGYKVTPKAVIVGPEIVLGADDLHRDQLVPATVAVWDPVGNSVGVAVAELLAATGRQVTFVTPDAIAGNLLSLTGDLAGSNVRLQQAGVVIERRHQLRRVAAGRITIEHSFSAETTDLAVGLVIDCSPRLPNDRLWCHVGPGGQRVGDAVAARTVGDAIREGRAAALALGTGSGGEAR